jgi:hypothetical protein
MQKFQTYQFKTQLQKEVQRHTRRNPQCLKEFILLESIIKKSLHKNIQDIFPFAKFLHKLLLK